MKPSIRLFNVLAVFAILAASAAFAANRTVHTSSKFTGPKANTGTAMHLYDGN